MQHDPLALAESVDRTATSLPNDTNFHTHGFHVSPYVANVYKSLVWAPDTNTHTCTYSSDAQVGGGLGGVIVGSRSAAITRRRRSCRSRRSPTVPDHYAERYRILIDFRNVDPGVFVFRCHVLFHEDHGMMGVVEVLPPIPGKGAVHHG